MVRDSDNNRYMLLGIVLIVAVVATVIIVKIPLTSILPPPPELATIGSATFSPTLFSDNFNRPDTTAIGWTEIKGDLLIQNNTLRNAPRAGYNAAIIAPTGNDEDVTASFTSTDNNVGPRFGIILRYRDPNNYYLLYRQTGGSSQLRISRVVNGVETTIKTAGISNPQKGVSFSLRAQAIGSNLTVSIGTIRATVIDSTFTSGGMGLLMGAPSGTASHIADDFTASYTGGGTPVPPAAPSNLAAIGIAPIYINVTWLDNSANEQGFAIERAPASAGPWAQITTTTANTVTYLDGVLNSNTTYYYRVRAFNPDGNSAYSNVANGTTLPIPGQGNVSMTPNAPTNLAAFASGSIVNLTWTDNSNNELGFKIEGGTASTGPWTQLAITVADVRSYSIATANTYFRVRAYNDAGNSTYSNVAQASTLNPQCIPISFDGQFASHLNIVFVPSNFSGNMALFAQKVNWIINSTFNKYEPYNISNPKLNYFYAAVESGSYCNYNCNGIDRLLCCTNSIATSASSKCTTGQRQTVVIHNNQKYGGSGGSVPVTSVDSAAPLIAAHEMAHGIFGLWDEYDNGINVDNHVYPNCDYAACSKWADLIGYKGVNCHAGCRQAYTSESTIMLQLGLKFEESNLRNTCCTYARNTGTFPPYCAQFSNFTALNTFCHTSAQQLGAQSLSVPVQYDFSKNSAGQWMLVGRTLLRAGSYQQTSAVKTGGAISVDFTTTTGKDRPIQIDANEAVEAPGAYPAMSGYTEVPRTTFSVIIDEGQGTTSSIRVNNQAAVSPTSVAMVG